jgi:hypothetical protein
VREKPLEWIWYESPSFNAFRGFDWMPEPCRSCPAGRQHVDFGGCRCQAFALTGDASRTDPVCQFSPDHWMVERAVAEAEAFQLASAGTATGSGTGVGNGHPAGAGRGEPEEGRVPAAAEASGAADSETGLVYRTPQSMRKVLKVLR